MDSASAPWLFSFQGPWRRIVYVAFYEGLAIAIVTISLWLLTSANTGEAGFLAVASSAIAVTWNLIFNWLFEQWEARQDTRGRSVRRRIAHALGFEFGLLFWLVPLYAWWLKVSLWHALVLDSGLLVFFLFYTYVFTWGFDKLFGLPAAVQHA